MGEAKTVVRCYTCKTVAKPEQIRRDPNISPKAIWVKCDKCRQWRSGVEVTVHGQ